MATKNRTQLTTASNNTFQDAPDGNITPTTHRAFNVDCIDSFANLDDDNTYSGTNTFNGAVIMNSRFDTAADSVAAAGVMDIGTAVSGNYLNITGTASITDFGNSATIGNWRWLKFDGVCTITHSSAIQCPNSQNIETLAGDRCLVICVASGEWMIHTYQRADGSSLVGVVYPYTYSGAAPTFADDDVHGFQKGFRWIQNDGSGNMFEYICTYNATNNAVWLKKAGTFGIAGDGKDLEIDSISINFAGSALPPPNYDMRYSIESSLLLIEGWIEADMVLLNGANPNGDFGILTYPNSGLINIQTGSIPASGFGVGWWNGAGLPHPSRVWVDGTANTDTFYVKIATTNPHFGNTPGTIRLNFTATIPFAL